MVDWHSYLAMCVSKPEGTGQNRTISLVMTSYWFLDITQDLTYLNYVEFSMTKATIRKLLKFSYMKLLRI